MTGLSLPRQSAESADVARGCVVVVEVDDFFGDPPLTANKTMIRSTKTTAPVAT